MNKTFAVIENDKVVNIVLSETATADNWVETDQAGPGWVYQGGQFLPPPPVVPTKEEQEAKRHADYTAEADPLFFKWQADEGTEEEWKAKRQEIRDRYPYPAE